MGSVARDIDTSVVALLAEVVSGSTSLVDVVVVFEVAGDAREASFRSSPRAILGDAYARRRRVDLVE